MSQVILLTPPLAEPVGLIEAKAHLRLEHDRDDMALIGLVRSARELCERFTRRALIEQRRELRLDRPPSLFRIHRMVTLPYPPLIQVEEVAMLEPGGGESILAASNYEAIVGGEGAGRVSFHAVPENSGALAVRFRCGYGPSPEDVPAPLRQGMLMLIAHWYEQREAASQAEGSSAPFGVEALWRPYRMVSL